MSQICTFEEFLAEVTPSVGSLAEAAQSNELVFQQLQDYLARLKQALCTDITNLETALNSIADIQTFLGLTDTPNSYAGQAGNVAAVNAAEDGLEFVAPGGGGGLPDLADNVEVASGRVFDGNDTYFKMRDCGALPNTATKNVAHNIGAAFTLCDAWGVATDETGQVFLPLIFSTHTFLTNTAWYYLDATNIIITTGSNRAAFTKTYIVVEYYYQ